MRVTKPASQPVLQCAGHSSQSASPTFLAYSHILMKVRMQMVTTFYFWLSFFFCFLPFIFLALFFPLP